MIQHYLRLVRFVATLVGAGVISWYVGLQAYRLALRLLYGEDPRGDWGAVVFWSGLVYFPALLLVYLPILAWLDNRLEGPRRLLLFPLTGAAVAIFPVAAIGGIFRSRSSGFSPEALLFAVLFGAAGATFALAYSVLSRRL
jgi:hypothetical protein